MVFESENIEFKVQLTDEIYKEVIAFANTGGGTIYIGIDDNGNPVGINNVDDTYTRITNSIRDLILPDVTMFIKYTLQDNMIIKITVSEGSSKPYYLKAKGLKPSGVYVRQGASSVQASSEQIRQMIKVSDGDVFEETRSLEQYLTFDSAAKAFEKYGVEFSKEKYYALGIVDMADMLFTNLALIVSDQCKHSIKIAVFADEENTIFTDTKEFKGSIFKQLEDAFSYLMLCNKTNAQIKGLERIENPDYPEEVFREALLNALVHRDYSYSGSIIINVNNKKTEFISIGGLLPGLSPEDIKSGISQPRNKRLAEIFHRLKLIESYGTGIRRIYNHYKNCSEKPRIEVTPNTFKITVPNMNYGEMINETSFVETQITEQMRMILDFISINGEINKIDVQELLEIKSTRAYNILRQMENQGVIASRGRGSSKVYVKS